VKLGKLILLSIKEMWCHRYPIFFKKTKRFIPLDARGIIHNNVRPL